MDAYDRVLSAACYSELTLDQLRALSEHFKQLHRRREADLSARAAAIPEDDRVAAGMAWLDEHYPDHVARFNAARFDIMGRVNHDRYGNFLRDRLCVLSQAAGELDCRAAADRHNETLSQWEMLGMVVPDIAGEAYEGRRKRVDRLNQAWLDAYAARHI